MAPRVRPRVRQLVCERLERPYEDGLVCPRLLRLAALLQLRAGLEVVLGALRSARSEKQILAVLQAELKAAVLRQGA